MRKKGKVIFIGCLLIVLLTLFLYSLSEELYYEWLEDEYNIERITGYNGYTYTKDDTEIFFSSSHERLFIRDQNFIYENGELFTIKSLRVYKTFFAMNKENILWRLFFW